MAKSKNKETPCYFSPLSEIPGSIELLEKSLTYEGVQWRKIVEWKDDGHDSKIKIAAMPMYVGNIDTTSSPDPHGRFD